MNKCKFCFKECKGDFCNNQCKSLYNLRQRLHNGEIIDEIKEKEDKRKEKENRIKERENKRQEKLQSIKEKEQKRQEEILLQQEKREQKRLIKREKETLRLQIKKQRRNNNSIVLKNFNNIRNRYNLNLTDISKMLGISPQAVSSWSNIRCRIPKTRIKELSKLLGIPEEQFYEGIEENGKIDL